MPRRRRGVTLDRPFGCILALPFLLGICVLGVLWIFCWPIAVGATAMGSWRFKRLMKKRNRYIGWEDLKPHLERGDGTLLFQWEQGSLAGYFWWTEQDVKKISPIPCTEEKQYDRSPGRLGEHPFTMWCHEYYTNEDTGTALLIVDHQAEKDDKVFEQYTSKVPNLMTGFRRAITAAERKVLEILKQDHPTAKAQLIALLADTKRDVRDIAAATLGTFGPEASDAAPALVRALEMDPDGSSFFALIDIGPEALPALQELADRSVGKLKKDANALIHTIERKKPGFGGLG